MIQLSSVTFGSDAEVFLRTLNKQPIPVCGMVGGTKDNPKPIPELPEGFAYQEDNAALELNVPKTNNLGMLYGNLRDILGFMRHKLPHSVILDMENCTVEFDESYLNIPAMRVFGCDPDYNAWTGVANERPEPPTPGQRTAAAHIHIGWNDPNDDDRIKLIQFSDIFAVLPDIPHQHRSEEERRKMYGRAGAFRWKKYGVEHRVKGNTWLFNGRTAFKKSFQGYCDALAAVNCGLEIDSDDVNRIQHAINKPDPKLAVLLHEKYVRKLGDKVGPDFSFSQLYKLFGAGDDVSTW